MADGLGELSRRVQHLRWQIRVATGYDPVQVKIPKRFTEVTTWKGRVDEGFMETMRLKYAAAILKMGKGKAIDEGA